MKRLVTFGLVLLLGASVAFAAGGKEGAKAGASSGGPGGYPSRPINFLVGYGAGGGMDISARALQPALEKALGGATINVVNKPGATSWIVYEEVARSKPDGYTISMVNLPGIYGYLDPKAKRTSNLSSFQLLGNLVTDYCIYICRKDETRFNTMKDLIEYAKKNEVTCSTAGTGSDDDFMLKATVRDTGANMTAVPGAGWSEILPALLGGHVDIACSNVGEALASWKNGEVKALCVFSPQRSTFMPDIPTWNESGFGTQIVMSSQRGVMMPAGGDPKIVQYLSAKIAEAMDTKEYKDKMIQLGLLAEPLSAEQYTAEAKKQESFFAAMKDLIWGN